MKIILINPTPDSYDRNDTIKLGGFFVPPFWAINLATYLRIRMPEAEIKILDGQILYRPEMIADLRSFYPEIVGISPMYINYKNALDLARVAKRGGAKVVMGGHYATGLARQILLNRGPGSQDYCVDAIIQQDGEEAFYQWVSGMPSPKIKNLVYWEDDIVKFNDTELLDLNKLPFPDWHLVDVEKYFKLRQKMWPNFPQRALYFYSRKGCGWRTTTKGGCLYCSLMYKEMRIRKPELVVGEIDYLIKKYKINSIWDISDDFLDNEVWFQDFYNLYNDYEPKPIMQIYSRADRINPNVAGKLRQLRITNLSIGLESGDSSSLRTMKKGITSDINKQAIQISISAGLWPICNFIFGAPGESSQSLKNTLKFVDKLKLNKLGTIVPHIFTPLPNSLAFDMLLERTGEKFYNKDVLDSEELVQEWVRLFCAATLTEILAALHRLATIANHI